MWTGRRITRGIVATGLTAGLILAVMPLSYTSPAGTRKGEVFPTPVTVSCGTALIPKWPHPPPGADDESDAIHIKRWILLAVVLVATAVLAGVALALTRRAARPAYP